MKKLLCILALLLLSSVACSAPVRIEPSRAVVEHPEFVRLAARDSVPGEIKVLVLNLGKEPLTVLYDRIEVETEFGKLRRAQPTGSQYTVPPQGSRLLTLKFSAKGLRQGDAVYVLFDDAIRSGERTARVNPLEFVVKN